MNTYEKLRAYDPELAGAMDRELNRQQTKIELIASENFVSEAVMEAMGTHLTNKYAEGYPGKRYYGGCEFVDEFDPSIEYHPVTTTKEKKDVKEFDLLIAVVFIILCYIHIIN